jgi:hypothetical protein
MGLNNFNNPAIQKQLNLTPAQMNQIRQLSTNMRSEQSNLNPSQYSQMWEQVNSILTPEQRQTWTQLTGERFDFGNSVGSGDGTVQSGFGTGGSQTQNGSTIGNGGATGNQNTDPSNNLTAPRRGRGIVPTGAADANGAGANSGSGSGTGGAQDSAGSSTTDGSANGVGAGDAGTGADSATGSSSSSK